MSTRPPVAGEAHIIWQCYSSGPSAADTAQRVIGGIRSSLPGSWLSEPFAILIANGRPYWWDGGRITDELLLTDRLPGRGEFAMVWDTYVEGTTFEELARQAAMRIAQQIRVVVADSTGATLAVEV